MAGVGPTALDETTLAFAPRSSAKSKPEEGNLSLHGINQAIRIFGSFEFLVKSQQIFLW